MRRRTYSLSSLVGGSESKGSSSASESQANECSRHFISSCLAAFTERVIDRSIGDTAVEGMFAYEHWVLRLMQREQFGVRRSQRCLLFAHKEHALRSVQRIIQSLVGVDRHTAGVVDKVMANVCKGDKDPY